MKNTAQTGVKWLQSLSKIVLAHQIPQGSGFGLRKLHYHIWIYNKILQFKYFNPLRLSDAYMRQ